MVWQWQHETLVGNGFNLLVLEYGAVLVWFIGVDIPHISS